MTDDPTISLGDPSDPRLAQQPAAPPPLLTTWGPFELLSRAGAGGFGEVYRAWDPHLQREIALKLLLPNAIAGEEAWQQMLREARALASVRHPNIVPVYGIDRHENRVGFWTDFIRGKTLAAIVREQGPFGHREAALMGIDICRALAAVHSGGLLHRDIKPENVMREEGGRILLMDFGLSTLPHAGAALAGTQSFMAPELFRGAAAAVASDIYAMGVLLYFLVSGAYPARVTGLSARQATEAIAHRKPLIDLRPDLPDSFVRTVSTALELDPTCRFQSAGQLAEALTSALNSGPISTSHASISSPGAPTTPYTAWQSITPHLTPAAPPPSGSVTPPPPANFRAAMEATATEALITATTRLKTIDWTRKKIIGALFATWLLWKIFFGCGSSSSSKSHEDDEDKSDKPAVTLHSGRTPEANTPAHSQYLAAIALMAQSYKPSSLAQATTQFQQLTQTDPSGALGWAGLSLAHLEQYNDSHDPKLLDQASSEADKALQLDPEIAPPYIALARIAVRQGNNAVALQMAQKAVQLDSTNADAKRAEAQVYAAQNRGEDADDAFDNAIDLAPDDWRNHMAYGVFLASSGKLDKAAEQFEKVGELAPDNPRAWYNLGNTRMRLNQLDKAEQAIQKSLQLDPDADTYQELAWLRIDQGRIPDAVEADKKAVELAPDRYNSWADLGTVYSQLPDQAAKAPAAFRKAAELAEVQHAREPKNADLVASLAYYYTRAGQPDRGRPLIRQALALAPANPKIDYQAGEIYALTGDRKQATGYILRAIGPGYSAAEIDHDPDLATLRTDPDFQARLKAALAHQNESH